MGATLAPETAFADDRESLAAGVGEFGSASGEVVQEQAVTYSPVYRMYNPCSGEHLYTTSKGERNYLASHLWHYEGVGWMTPSTGDKVHRLYNPHSGDHLYTLSDSEVTFLRRIGWRYEGTAFYASPASDTTRVPLYREFNPNEKVGTHNYTTAVSEHRYLASIGWRDEKVAWYVHSVPSNYKDDMKPWYPHISGDKDLDTQLDIILYDHKSLRSCYDYVANYRYISGNVFYSNPRYLPNSTTISYAKEMIRNRGGNCYRYASLMCWLAKGLGYDASVVSGWVPSYSGGRAPHGWVEVRQGGTTYVLDPDMYHELRGYNWYMVTYSNAPTTYGSW